jgi:uncharacterized protein (DUF1697 family)
MSARKDVSMTRYVALLRGINVGGRNLIKMSALKACFEKHGYEDVVTYIQSGNVLFSSSESAGAKLTRRIEKLLATTFTYQASVVLRSRKQMQNIVEGAQPAKYRYDVIFLKEPLLASTAVKNVPLKPGVDQAHAGKGVLYFSRLVSKASQSRLSKIVSLPIYQNMTIRNWNTTTKLLQMMQAKL